MITKMTLFVGCNDKEAKIQLFTNTECLAKVEKIVFDNKCDATYTMCKGNYTHEDGTRVSENTIKIEMLFFDGEKDAINTTRHIVDCIKVVLNQESVAVQIENINSDLW